MQIRQSEVDQAIQQLQQLSTSSLLENKLPVKRENGLFKIKMVKLLFNLKEVIVLLLALLQLRNE